MNERIGSADPRAAYRAAADEIDAAVRRVLASGRYVLGPEVEAFENEFAAWLGSSGCVGVASGTDAVELALRAGGIGAGDRVATVANTATATVAGIVAAGATPLFVEIDPATMLMDPVALARAFAGVATKIKAVVVVHLYGLPADMAAIVDLARRHGALVIEDAAQAHGASIGGRKAGTWGDLAGFSFYPTKNLGGCGDGGAVVGADARLLERVRRLREYGWRTRHVAEEHGINSRLDEIQAAILRVRLSRLDAENERRARIAATYRERLRGLPLTLPVVPAGRTPAWHQFVVRAAQRDRLRAALAARGIDCGVLYPVPIHRQPAYQTADTLPLTERACREVLSLPLHAGLSDGDVAAVATAVREIVATLG